MQVWILNDSACPPAVRQLPDGMLNLHDVDFYIWMKNILPKEDAAIFKQQFWHLFTVSGWFNTLTNAKYSKDSSVNGFMHLYAPKRCPPLKHGIKQSELAWWLGAHPGLTSELTSQVVEPFTEWHAEVGPPGMKQPGGPTKSVNCTWPPHQRWWNHIQSKCPHCSNKWWISHTNITMLWLSMNQRVPLLSQAPDQYLWSMIWQFCHILMRTI